MAAIAERSSQLPQRGQIFLDHVGHFVRDVATARSALAQAGFAPTPVSVHTQPAPDGAPRPTGTGNVTAMLRRGYVEVLFKTADTPLAQELDTALARYAGIHLMAFAVADAAGAHRRLGESGFRMRPLVEMQRGVDTGAAPGIAAFTVARLEAGQMPEGRIQLLTHQTEDTVWQPRWLAHPNGALGLTRAVIAVEDINEAAQRFARLTDRPARACAQGQSIALDRGHIELVSTATFSQMLPHVPIPSLPFIGAYGISVASLAVAEQSLVKGGLAPRRQGQDLMAAFPEALGSGAWLFSEGAAAGPQ